MVTLIGLIMIIFIIMMIIMILPMMTNTEKLGVLENYLKGLIDYYKPIRTDYGFGGRENNYIACNIQVEEIDLKIYCQKNIFI